MKFFKNFISKPFRSNPLKQQRELELINFRIFFFDNIQKPQALYFYPGVPKDGWLNGLSPRKA